MRTPFGFRGPIPASKSVLIRWLVIESYGGPLTIRGDSRCDDVRIARSALKALEAGRPMEMGDGAFGFRALAMRASRKPGTHVLHLGERLAERPHGPLVNMLRALGVQVAVDGCVWQISGSGWQIPTTRPLVIDGSFSSQFASSLLVNGWDLPAPLRFCAELPLSEGYFHLTRRQVDSLGLKLEGSAVSGWQIPAGFSVPAATVDAEPDMGSAFAVAALGAVAGYASLKGLTAGVFERSEQPDRRFVTILRDLGAEVRVTDTQTDIRHDGAFRPLDVDLGGSPDLFPVLAALLSLARGTSRLFGAPQLRAKESDRIATVTALLRSVGVVCEEKPDGLVLTGPAKLSSPPFRFDPGVDHRLVMAAAVLRAAGLPIEIAGTAVVAKSFPEFSELLLHSDLV